MPTRKKNPMQINSCLVWGAITLIIAPGCVYAGGNLPRVMRDAEAIAKRLQKTERPSSATIAALDITHAN